MVSCLWACGLCIVLPALLVGSLPYLVALVPHANFPVPQSPLDFDALLASVKDEERKTLLKPLVLDVSKEEEIVAAAETLRGSCASRFVGLINNAGISTKAPMETVPMDKFRTVLETNVFGLLSLTQKLIPLLRQAQGRIINVGSASGTLATPLSGTYSASKFALEAISDSLRLELRKWNVSVSMVNPAYVVTEIRQKAVSQLNSGMVQADVEYYPDLFQRALDKEPKLLEIGAPCCESTDSDILHALKSPVPRTRYFPGNVAKNIPHYAVHWIVPLLTMVPEIERLADIIKAKF
eukprot:CAMPEP_0206487286 /NCGR_PEP_ID=MMETSP0324_2-20121206/41534_1 /ASSEMBLY_ACC=CAM_ASM_000836 /TAXON_ID=2866 /ORGANISM="Crypthecodinium cohnii, Strain Seligo" /LENGTH=294 /DNA_ID=CAMNT_0053965705 /DNA_START=43 /DNA_END=928 /DNA_ORIENTATION=-